MKNKTQKKILLAFLMTLITALTTSIPPHIPLTYAQTTTLSIKPPSIENTTMHVGDTFTINASVTDVTDLYAWQIQLHFNATILNVTNAWYPTDHVFAGKTYMPVTPSIDNTNGKLIFAATLIGMQPGFDGDGTLCQIEFKIKQDGSSNLNFSKPYGTRTWIKDSDLHVIPATVTDGYFSNVPPPPPPPPPPQPATVYIDPARIVDPTITPCKNFTVDVKILNATNVYSFSFKIVFNQSTITAIDASLGDFFPSTITPTITIDNTQGFVLFLASIAPPEPPRSGNGTLAIIEFHVENLGTSDIQLHDVELKDEEDNTLPLVTSDGYFNNILMAKLAIEPAEVIDPTLRVGDLVEFNVTIDDVENLYGYSFELTYNTETLTCIGVFINPILNETHFTTKFSVDDEIGLLKVNVTYNSPAIPITTYTPLPFSKLYFIIDSLGSSVLHFQNTSLTDHEGNPISHETQDGFIMTLIRDVAVINIMLSRTWAYPGWPANITVTVKNEGNMSETFNVNTYYNSSLIGTLPVSDLAPNTETTKVFTWDTTGVAGGNYTIKAEATTVPNELDTADNILIDGTIELLSEIRDVAIINVSSSKTWVFSGMILNVTVTAKNVGNVSATFDIIAYCNTSSFGTFNVTDLPPLATITVIFPLNTSSLLVCYNYTLTGVVTAIPFEYDISNNILVNGVISIRYPGDISGDGFVDMSDIAIVAGAFGSYPGHPRWNPDADIDQDNWIDMTDISMVAHHFGEGCP